MVAVAKHRAEIVELAGRQTLTDATFRRLQNHSSIQYAYCLWGMGPGGLRDEESPFNACAHAYLAAANALLAHMQGMPDAAEAAEAIAEAIDRDRRSEPALAALCRYSDTPFSTAEIVRPRWSEIATHPPTVATFGGAGLMLAGGLMMARRRKPAA